MKKKIPTVSEQLEMVAKDIKDWKAGKAKLKTTLLEKDGTRTIWHESLPEEKMRRARQATLQAIRADLALSQSQMAAGLRIATKTLQGYEIGKPVPDSILVLAELLRDLPAVRKRLLAA